MNASSSSNYSSKAFSKDIYWRILVFFVVSFSQRPSSFSNSVLFDSTFKIHLESFKKIAQKKKMGKIERKAGTPKPIINKETGERLPQEKK